jgi:hypothetical protein
MIAPAYVVLKTAVHMVLAEHKAPAERMMLAVGHILAEDDSPELVDSAQDMMVGHSLGRQCIAVPVADAVAHGTADSRMTVVRLPTTSQFRRKDARPAFIPLTHAIFDISKLKLVL